MSVYLPPVWLQWNICNRKQRSAKLETLKKPSTHKTATISVWVLRVQREGSSLHYRCYLKEKEVRWRSVRGGRNRECSKDCPRIRRHRTVRFTEEEKRGRHGGIKGGRRQKHSQHEILLPARLTAAHSDGCALNILHLQGHVCVKFLCKKKNINTISHASECVHLKQPDLVKISNKWMISVGHNSPWGPSSLAFFTEKQI